MLIDTQADRVWTDIRENSQGQALLQKRAALFQETSWREVESCTDTAIEDITISRWQDQRSASRHKATTPHDRYFIGIALKATRLKLARERQIVFEGIMPAGTLYVSAPYAQLSAHFQAPCAFLHLHVPADHFAARRSPSQADGSESLNDLVLLRDPFAEQLAKALTAHGDAGDPQFARCIGQTLVMHLARLELPRAKVNALPKWRLRRVEEYVGTHFDRSIRLSDLANVAGLSRMHFAAQFRAATGYRPREFLLNHRIGHAKTLLSTTSTPLAQVALAVGFSTQAHFSTVFKRISGETPARWRSASKDESSDAETPARKQPAAQETWVDTMPLSPHDGPCEMRKDMRSRNTPIVRSAMVAV
jgi:AraC-like DNA-binding protein